MKFLLEIDCSGDNRKSGDDNPFGDSTGDEVARILRPLADLLETHGPRVFSRDEEDPFLLRDANGQSVGTACFTEKS